MNDTLMTMFCRGITITLAAVGLAVVTCLNCLPNGKYPVYLGFGKWVVFELGDPDWREREEDERPGD